jgi:hypothetical protein
MPPRSTTTIKRLSPGSATPPNDKVAQGPALAAAVAAKAPRNQVRRESEFVFMTISGASAALKFG